MRTFFTIILIAIVAATGWYLYQGALPLPTPASQESATPVEPDELTKIAARKHIEKLTQPSEQAIQIGQADHFVTDNQLLRIPLPKTGNQVALETVTEGNAASFGVDLGGIKTTTPSSAQGVIIGRELFPHNGDQIKLQELLNDPDNTQGKVFYIHAVNGSDRQGLWGIIQTGLIKTFASGITIKQDVISADIPQTADEKLADRRSSFLGTILNNKVQDTYVYNYEKGILGHNPDLITPGQELIIVTFSEDELIQIYNHFVGH